MDITIQKTRIKNLKSLIEDNFLGDYKEVAAKIKRTELTLRKYLLLSANRPISDDLARHIEQSLGLPENHLDIGEKKGNQIFYVLLKVEYYAPEVLEWIYDTFPEVMECAALYSEWDVLIKVSVPGTRQLEVVFGKLIRHPKIKTTKTLVTVENMRWQRTQEHIKLVEDPYKEEITNFVEQEKVRRIKHLLYEINTIEKGKYLPINEREVEHIPATKIMGNTRKKFWSTRAYKEKIRGYAKYIQLEKKKIESGVDIRRILLVPIDESKTTLAKKRLMDRYEEGKDIKHLGSDVRILPEYRWITNQHMRAPVSFALVDDLYIYERVPQKKQAFLIHGEEEIELYQELFLMNWGAGYTLEKIKEILNNWPEEREESDSV